MWPSRLLCPWDSAGKNTGVVCHFLLQGHLPGPGIEPASLMSPALAGGFFTTGTMWEAYIECTGILRILSPTQVLLFVVK